MTNEIKEIIDKLNHSADHYILYDYEIKTLLDYITNLQEIEKEHQKINGELRQEITNLQEEKEKQHKGFLAVCEEAKDLEQRIDKANSILNKLVVMKPWENTDNPMRKIYRPIKNTTKQEVYRAIVELEDILRGDE